jgi:hypothetical protein
MCIICLFSEPMGWEFPWGKRSYGRDVLYGIMGMIRNDMIEEDMISSV